MKKVLFGILIFMIGILQCDAYVNEKYFKTVLLNDNYFISKEITKEEYESISEINLLSSSVETEYKKMVISVSGSQVQLSIDWKKTPKYKSYDVIAIMSDDVSFIANTLIGVQTAILSDDTEIINYSFSGQNSKLLNNGIGVSMNLVNDAIYYSLTLRVRTNGSGNIYGNYRHAQANVSLDQSQNYYFENGNIIFNNTSINNKYDSILPVMITV